MTPDVMAKAFDPFFTTKSIGHGTRLGLSMLHGFIKQSEGHVGIASEPGRGTTFEILLPRHQRGVDDKTDLPQRPVARQRLAAGETVLVVDDEAAVRVLVIETLEELGYASIEADDGPSGLAILQSNARIDLLITDVGLSGLNGRRLADAGRVLRASRATRTRRRPASAAPSTPAWQYSPSRSHSMRSPRKFIR